MNWSEPVLQQTERDNIPASLRIVDPDSGRSDLEKSLVRYNTLAQPRECAMRRSKSVCGGRRRHFGERRDVRPPCVFFRTGRLLDLNAWP